MGDEAEVLAMAGLDRAADRSAVLRLQKLHRKETTGDQSGINEHAERTPGRFGIGVFRISETRAVIDITTSINVASQ